MHTAPHQTASIRSSAIKARLQAWLHDTMLIPGLSGYEGRIRQYLATAMTGLGIDTHSDRLGNLIGTIKGNPDAPSVMLFTHMDQLGFVVRKIEDDGFVRIERVGGVPERALASQMVLFQIGEGLDRLGIIANKSHHATTPEEKYQVVPYQDRYIDTGLESKEAVLAAGIKVGTPIVYKPQSIELAPNRIAGTSVDDRAGCAVLLETARALLASDDRPTVHIVYSVQEEFNLRGVLPAVQALKPDIAIQLDLVLANDTPDMGSRGDVTLGAGPAMSLFSFHGRGTLNGTIPHPGLVQRFEQAARDKNLRLQRSAHIGALTETSYVQLEGDGVAVIDVGFPMRFSHSSLELCDLNDLLGLTTLLTHAISSIDATFSLSRDDYAQ